MKLLRILYGSITQYAYCCAQTKHSEFSKFFLLYIPYLTKHFYLMSKNFSGKIGAEYYFVITLYFTNVCRVIGRITEVVLLNNFQTESWSVLPVMYFDKANVDRLVVTVVYWHSKAHFI